MRLRSPRPGIVFVAAALLGLPLFAASAQIIARTNPNPRPAAWAVKLARTNLSNFYLVTTNLYRGAQPSARGMTELKAAGVKMVINLRSFHSDDDEARGVLEKGLFRPRPQRGEGLQPRVGRRVRALGVGITQRRLTLTVTSPSGRCEKRSVSRP